MPRLFTGLEIPPDVAQALSFKRGGLVGARWLDPADYHITLRFIGDVDNSVANEVVDALDRLSDSPGFTISLTDYGVFGGDKPRTLYASVEPNSGLMHLQSAQERVLQRLGLVPDGRKFTPHVTLARLRGIQPEDVALYLAQAAYFEPLTFTPSRFVLYSSRDSIGGGPYVVEESFALTPPDIAQGEAAGLRPR